VLTDPPLPDGAERRVLVGDTAAEIPKLVGAVRDLVQNLTQLTAQESEFRRTLANLQTATARLNGPRGALGVLFGNDADAKRLVATIERANALLARFDRLAANADTQFFGTQGLVPEARGAVAQLAAALEEARASLRRVDAVLADAQVIAGNAKTATTDLGSLRAEVEASLRKIESLVDDINRRWPFARDTELKLP
jgi:phospholipid/cholesterol/gamma-HCH transport system substrate-binding protein